MFLNHFNVRNITSCDNLIINDQCRQYPGWVLQKLFEIINNLNISFHARKLNRFLNPANHPVTFAAFAPRTKNFYCIIHAKSKIRYFILHLSYLAPSLIPPPENTLRDENILCR